MTLVCNEISPKTLEYSITDNLSAMAESGRIEYVTSEYGWDNSVVPAQLKKAAETSDVVICQNLGFGMAASWLRTNAKNYPATQFIVVDEATDLVENVPNVHMVAFRNNESAFLAGVLAAQSSQTDVVAFAGSMECDMVDDYRVGFTAGAKYANPACTVLSYYIGSETAANVGKDYGVSAIGQGADVFYAKAKTAGFGFLEAAAETGKMAIGAEYDIKSAHPDRLFTQTVATSTVIDAGIAVEQLVGNILAGTHSWKQLNWYGLAQGCVGLAENDHYNTVVSSRTRDYISIVQRDIANGILQIPSAYNNSSASLTVSSLDSSLQRLADSLPAGTQTQLAEDYWLNVRETNTYSTYFAVAPQGDVYDISLITVKAALFGSGKDWAVDKTLAYYTNVKPGSTYAFRIDSPGTVPYYGVQVTDFSGNVTNYYFAVHGGNGQPLIVQF